MLILKKKKLIGFLTLVVITMSTLAITYAGGVKSPARLIGLGVNNYETSVENRTDLKVANKAFIPNDILIGDENTAYMNLEISPDMKYMSFMDQNNNVWICGIDKDTGELIPSDGKGFKIANIRPSGQPQWGTDENGSFVIMGNMEGQFVTAYPKSPYDSLVKVLDVPADTSRKFPYPSRISAGNSAYIAYCKNDDQGVIQLWYLNMANPKEEHQVTFGEYIPMGKYNMPPFFVDIVRWFYDASTGVNGLPILTFGWTDKENPTMIVKQLDLSQPNATPTTIAKASPSMLDDFPTIIDGERYILSGLNGQARGGLFKRSPGSELYSSQVQSILPNGSNLSNPMGWSSAEAFEWKGKYYSAFQISGSILPGATPSEIWITSLLDNSVMHKISGDSSLNRCDPEFFIGNNKAWIFYYARSSDAGKWEMHRCDAGLANSLDVSSSQLDESSNRDTISNSPQKANESIIFSLDSAYALVNGNKIPINSSSKATPLVVNERTLLPIRFLSENFGAKVEWDEKTSTATIIYNDNVAKVTLGSKILSINDNEVIMDITARSEDGRIFIPLRAIAENVLNKKVFYKDGIIIISPNIVQNLEQKYIEVIKQKLR